MSPASRLGAQSHSHVPVAVASGVSAWMTPTRCQRSHPSRWGAERGGVELREGSGNSLDQRIGAGLGDRSTPLIQEPHDCVGSRFAQQVAYGHH
jgi:hypothetical protein